MNSITTDRRGFMKLGLVGSAVLTSGSMIATLSGCSKQPASEQGYRFFRPQDVEFLSALIPVIAGKYPGGLGDQAVPRVLAQLDKLMFTLQGHAQSEIVKLFDAMSFAPVRVAAGAQWADWKDATPEQIESFLEGWRTSIIPLKRMGYFSLAKLINIAWYSQPENYPISGYPGAPVKVPAVEASIDELLAARK